MSGRHLVTGASVAALFLALSPGANGEGQSTDRAAFTQSGSSVATKHFNGQVFDIPDPLRGGRGGQIYLQVCARCHNQGIGGAPQRVAFIFMSPQSIFRTLTDGAMKAEAAGLSRRDMIAVAEFLTRKRMSASERDALPVCRAEAARFDFDQPPVFPGYGLAPGNNRFEPATLSGLNKASVGRLRLRWVAAFPNASQMRSEPALAGGALYVGSQNGDVYALDQATGCERWAFHAGSVVRTGVVISPWKSGDDRAEPRAYFGDFTGNVYAVNARTGRLVWRVRADPNPMATITGTPALHAGTLYVPVSSFEAIRAGDPAYPCCRFRGSVVAFDAKNGNVRWTTYTTGRPRLTGRSANGVEQYGPSGAAVWNSPTVDPERGQLYIGTGQNYSSPASNTSDAVMALDLATGAVRWVYQAMARDAMNLACVSQNKANCPKENGSDFDFGGAGTMLVRGADGRQLVVAARKSGNVYALEPDTGKLVWKSKPGRGGMLGGVEFGLAANRHLVFAAIDDAPDGREYPGPAHPGIYALDFNTGRIVWSAPAEAQCGGVPHAMNGYWQAITATPGLLLAGSDDGCMRIFDADTGAVLWTFDAERPVGTVTGRTGVGGSFGGGAGPIVYHGTMYVSAGYSIAGMTPGNLLIAFSAKK